MEWCVERGNIFECDLMFLMQEDKSAFRCDFFQTRKLLSEIGGGNRAAEKVTLE